MNIRQRLLAAFAFFLALWMVSTTVLAGPVTIRIPNGGKVQIKVTYKNGTTADVKTTDDSAIDENKNPGTFTVTVPDEANAKTVEVVSLGAISALPTISEFEFGVAGLMSFEPVNLFAFASLDGRFLLAETNVPTFLAGSNPFSEGEEFSVTAGSFSGADGIVFRDATGLYGSFFDVFVELNPLSFDSLPLYTGRAIVQPNVQFRVPEPASLLLVALGLVALNCRTRRPGI